MGLTIDILRGKTAVYLTCDCCGLPILGRAEIDEPPSDGQRDYERVMHADGCPEDEDETRENEGNTA